ncbi:hypothetical protein ACIRPX_32795 [Streptomyces sp. NPDC101225]|uniref:hypothetical protein n=1 Tax=Streptomyces sp. NPDC101225 TaxID=3366135 RepID=UPI003815CDAE
MGATVAAWAGSANAALRPTVTTAAATVFPNNFMFLSRFLLKKWKSEPFPSLVEIDLICLLIFGSIAFLFRSISDVTGKG